MCEVWLYCQSYTQAKYCNYLTCRVNYCALLTWETLEDRFYYCCCCYSFLHCFVPSFLTDSGHCDACCGTELSDPSVTLSCCLVLGS